VGALSALGLVDLTTADDDQTSCTDFSPADGKPIDLGRVPIWSKKSAKFGQEPCDERWRCALVQLEKACHAQFFSSDLPWSYCFCGSAGLAAHRDYPGRGAQAVALQFPRSRH
jgi:hypothetical protein